MTDPVFQDEQKTQNQNNQSNSNDGIFGGSDDIFENEDMFEPVQKSENNEENDEIKTVENQEENEISTPENEIKSNETIQEDSVEENIPPIQNLEEFNTEQNEIIQDESENTTTKDYDNIFDDEENDEQNLVKEDENITTEEPNKQIQELESLNEINENSVENKNTETDNTLEELENINEERTEKESEIYIAPVPTEENKNIETEKKENKTIDQTGLQQLFYDLLFNIKDIYKLKNLEDNNSFDLNQGDIKYNFNVGFNEITIIKTLKDTSNELKFEIETKPKNLVVIVNEQKLYSEKKELTENEKNKIKVQEKLKKFLVLIDEEINTIKQQQKDEKLNGVFRDF